MKNYHQLLIMSGYFYLFIYLFLFIIVVTNIIIIIIITIIIIIIIINIRNCAMALHTCVLPWCILGVLNICNYLRNTTWIRTIYRFQIIKWLHIFSPSDNNDFLFDLDSSRGFKMTSRDFLWASHACNNTWRKQDLDIIYVPVSWLNPKLWPISWATVT